MGTSSVGPQDWFVLLQSIGIIAGLLFTAFSRREETNSRRVSNLLTITEHHRELWSQIYGRPELKRVLDEHVDLQIVEVTAEEEIFANFLIFHLHGVFYARKAGLVLKLEGLRQDVRRFFALPIPRAVWKKTKGLQNDEFVQFVESCLEPR